MQSLLISMVQNQLEKSQVVRLVTQEREWSSSPKGETLYVIGYTPRSSDDEYATHW